jgi:DNA-binding MarR family transcriptional regulator
LSTPTFDRGANRLGALALRLTDRMHMAVTAEGARSLSAATALSAIERFFVDGPSIDDLRRVLGLTSSGAVRLVDGLEADGLVRRRRGVDGRVSIVTLTAKGRRTARSVVDARAAVLTEALAPLTAAERAVLDPIVDKVLVGLVRGARPAAAMCRLCATEACGAARGEPCEITRTALGLDVGRR